MRENFRRLAEALGVDEKRFTLTRQIHETEVSVVGEEQVGMGLHRPMAWRSDAIVTALPDTPLCGFYADCVVTLLYDPATHTAGVAHAGWRGMAGGILPKTVEVMVARLGARRESLIAVSGPSIQGRSALKPTRMCRRRWSACSAWPYGPIFGKREQNSMSICRASA